MKFRVCLIFILLLFFSLAGCKNKNNDSNNNNNYNNNNNNNSGSVVITPPSGDTENENIDLDIAVRIVNADKHGDCSANYNIKNGMIYFTAIPSYEKSFIGWFLDEECNDDSLFSDETSYDVPTKEFIEYLDSYEENKTVSVYVMFGTSHTIEFDLNGGISNDNLMSFFFEEKEYSLPKNVSKDGYEFEGWYDDNGNKYDKIPLGTKNDLVLTAKWQVVYDQNSLVNSVWEIKFNYEYTDTIPISIVIKFREDNFVDIYYYANGYHINIGNKIEDDMKYTQKIWLDIVPLALPNELPEIEGLLDFERVTDQKNYFIYREYDDKIYIYLNKEAFYNQDLAYNLYGREPIMISSINGSLLEVSRFTLMESSSIVDENNENRELFDLSSDMEYFVNSLMSNKIYKKYTPYESVFYAQLIANSQADYEIKNYYDYENDKLKGKMFLLGEEEGISCVVYFSNNGYMINLYTDDFKNFNLYYIYLSFQIYCFDNELMVLGFNVEEDYPSHELNSLIMSTNYCVKFLTYSCVQKINFDLIGDVLYILGDGGMSGKMVSFDPDEVKTTFGG